MLCRTVVHCIDAIHIHKMQTSPRSMYCLHNSSAYGLLGAAGSQILSHQPGSGVPEYLGACASTSMGGVLRGVTLREKNCH